MLDEEYFQINHKNTIRVLTQEDINMLDVQISTYELLETDIGTEINKYFEIIIHHKHNDLFTASQSISKTYFMKNKINKKDLLTSICYFSSTGKIQSNLFVFKNDNIEHLGRILMYAYKKLKKSTVSSNDMFIKGIEMIKTNSINMIQLYKKTKEKYQKTSLLEVFKEFRYDKNQQNMLPPEMIYLINLMKTVNRLQFDLINLTPITFEYFLMILCNVAWIFSSFDNLSSTITNDSLMKLLYSKYGRDLNIHELNYQKNIKRYNYKRKGRSFKRKMLFLTNHINTTYIPEETNTSSTNDSIESIMNMTSSSILSDTTIISPGKNSIRKQSKLRFSDIINHFSFCLEYIIVSSYFVSQWKNLKTLSLVFSETYTKEITHSLKDKYQLNLFEFDFLNFYLKLSQLSELNLEFNSLDFKVFEPIFTMIHKNKSLQILRLNLFLAETHYNPAGLYKLYKTLGIFSKEIFPMNTILCHKLSLNDDVDHMIVNHLLPKFNENMQLLFWCLKDMIIKELSIIADFPDIIINNENYGVTLLKFILNCFLFINTSKCPLRIMKIIMPFITMDTRTYPSLEDFFDLIDIKKHNNNLKHFSLQIRLFDIRKLHRVISPKLQSIYIGDMNQVTFDCFINAITSKGFRQDSEIVVLSISLLPFITDYNQVKDSLIKLCNITMPQLKILEFQSRLCLHEKDYKEFLNAINNVYINEFRFTFSKSSIPLKKEMKQLYCYAYCEQIEIINHLIKDNKSIAKKIVEYLVKKNEVMLTVSYK